MFSINDKIKDFHDLKMHGIVSFFVSLRSDVPSCHYFLEEDGHPTLSKKKSQFKMQYVFE